MAKGRLFYAYVTGMCLVLATLLFTACKDSEELEVLATKLSKLIIIP